MSDEWQRARGDMRVRLHDWRHWYATKKLLESGQVTIRELSEVLGHAQVSTTLNIYTHASEDSRTRAAAVIGRHLD